MKKQMKIKTGIILLAILSTFLISCGYEPVFYGIMHDVLPEEATVSGNISAIARCTIDSGNGAEEYLFLSGGGTLQYKDNDSAKHGEWKTYNNLPFEKHRYNYFPTSSTPEGHIGQQIFRVLADQNNIYLLTASYRTDTDYGIVLPAKFYLWTCPLDNFFNSKKTDWINITDGKEDTYYPTKYNSSEGIFETYFTFFMTNSPKKEHRHVFFSTSTSNKSTVKYYKLNGTDIDEIDSNTFTGNYIPTNENNTKVNSAFYLGNTLYYSDSLAVTTNETFDTAATIACLGGMTKNYYLNSHLFTYDGTNLTEAVDVGSPIASLTMTKDSVLIGKGSYYSTYTSNGGISRVLLDADGKPENTTAEFTNNAKYQFTSSYILMSLLCADPSKTEEESSLYATITFRGTGTSSTASFSNIGLWSYYPSRGNWNRE